MSWWLLSFKKYAEFSGRSRRTEYWMFSILGGIASFPIIFISELGELGAILAIGFVIGLIIPGLALYVRRLHDTSNSGWLVLLHFIPILGQLPLYYLLAFKDSDPGENEYGPNPKTVDTVPPDSPGPETTHVKAYAKPPENILDDPLEKLAPTELKKQVEQGDAGGQYNVGRRHYDGDGVPQDYSKAVKWFSMAAEQGHRIAQCNLGTMYKEGQGLVQDYIQAHKFFNLAASNLKGEERETAVKSRDEVAEKMTPEQVAEAQRLAVEWNPVNVRDGNLDRAGRASNKPVKKSSAATDDPAYKYIKQSKAFMPSDTPPRTVRSDDPAYKYIKKRR